MEITFYPSCKNCPDLGNHVHLNNGDIRLIENNKEGLEVACFEVDAKDWTDIIGSKGE